LSSWSNWSHGKRVGALTALVTIVLLPIVIFVVGPNMPPGKDTNVAKGQVFDNTVLLIVMTPFTAFILTYLVYAVIAFRVKESEPIRDGAHIRGHMKSQVAWLASTTVAVLFLAIFGTAELLTSGAGGGQGPHPIAKPAHSGNALPVQVIGQQWEFTYRYPTFGGVETAQLVLPVDRPIALHVTSIDAIHSFWAYELGVKADANPGVDNVVYFTVHKTRTFQIRCAELCGLWHGYMYDTGRVVDEAQFTSFVDQQRKLFAGSQKYLPPYSTTYAPDPQFRAG
jgi:cytochrome c oxidase subunit II